MSTAQGRHAASRHTWAPRVVAFLAALLFLAAFLTGPGNHAAPVTGAPGPQVLRPPAASQQVTVRPRHAAMHPALHREHLAHLAHAEREHVWHLRHVAHVRHEAGIT